MEPLRIDLKLDGCGARQGIGSEQERGAEGAASVVDLGLGKVERVFSFDIAGAHVVADGVAGDDSGGADEQSELGFGHGPGGVGADANGPVGAYDAAAGGLEEDLGAFGVVDAVVEGSAAGVFGLFDARIATAEVGDACGPDLLVADRSEDLAVVESWERFAGECGL